MIKGVVLTDIETMGVDAIVNAANETLLGGGGVDGAIHRAAGPELAEFCSKLPTLGKSRCGIDDYIRCRPGQAVLTPAFNLPCRAVIHTVGPVWEGGWREESKVLSRCYANCLNVASKNGIKSMSFPCISTGVYRFPLRLATEIAIYTVGEWFDRHPQSEIDVCYVVHTEHAADVYEEMLMQYFDYRAKTTPNTRKTRKENAYEQNEKECQHQVC